MHHFFPNKSSSIFFSVKSRKRNNILGKKIYMAQFVAYKGSFMSAG